MTDDATTEPGWYWIRSSDSDAEFPIRLREDGYWLLRGRPDSPCLPPSWSIVARIDDLLRDAARYPWLRDADHKLAADDDVQRYIWYDTEEPRYRELTAEEFGDAIDAEIAREKGP
jgi:hypothetical protein